MGRFVSRKCQERHRALNQGSGGRLADAGTAKAVVFRQCRVPSVILCIRISILMCACGIENSAARAATNIDAVSKESAISSPHAAFSSLARLYSLTWTV